MATVCIQFVVFGPTEHIIVVPSAWPASDDTPKPVKMAFVGGIGIQG